MLPSLPALLALSLACSEGFHKDPSTDTASGDGGQGGTTFGADLPPVDENLDRSGCEEVSGTALPGATVYFLGIYVKGSDGWNGREEVRLHANGTWQASGGEDCSLVWAVSASEASTGACGNCDLGLYVSAVLDRALTTCPEDFYEAEETFSVGYGIDLLEDATRSSWYFQSSGTHFGDGYAQGTVSAPTAVNFVSEKTCWWL